MQDTEIHEFPSWVQHALDCGLITSLEARRFSGQTLPLTHGSPLQLIGRGRRGHVTCRCRFTLAHTCTKLPAPVRFTL